MHSPRVRLLWWVVLALAGWGVVYLAVVAARAWL